jgi:hypothetical protein
MCKTYDIMTVTLLYQDTVGNVKNDAPTIPVQGARYLMAADILQENLNDQLLIEDVIWLANGR